MILELHKQVASRELCERLRALGVSDRTAFAWMQIDADWHLSPNDGWHVSDGAPHFPTDVPAYTVAELGELLKGQHYLSNLPSLRTEEDTGNAHSVAEELTDGGWQWTAYLERDNIQARPHRIHIARTQADALAMLLVDLITNDAYQPAALRAATKEKS